MVEFCPDCGSLLRKKYCDCGYKKPYRMSEDSNVLIKKLWDPPSANIVYCKLTGTSMDRLKYLKSKGKGNYQEKLNLIRKKLNTHKYTCCNCLYYNEKKLHCQIKNEYFEKDSICKRFEPSKI